MSQENTPRFSHITVGRTDVDGPQTPELPPEEEVIVIGAVEAEAEADGAADGVVEGAVEAEAAVEIEAEIEAEAEEPRPSRVAQLEDDLDFDAPLPHIQKVVIGVCIIALVITIAALIWYWSNQ